MSKLSFWHFFVSFIYNMTFVIINKKKYTIKKMNIIVLLILVKLVKFFIYQMIEK
jgi:hypothetical protein